MRSFFDRNLEYSSCGVGFITNKATRQTHELLTHAHQALCKIPHRGGFSAEGIGDGAGVNVDISLEFYRHLCKRDDLQLGDFGVANFFYPRDPAEHERAEQILREVFAKYSLDIILWREVDVDASVLNEASAKAQLLIHQIVFTKPAGVNSAEEFEALINSAIDDIEQPAFEVDALEGFYPLSMSSKTQVYKGRLNSWEVIPYFKDLSHPKHSIHTLFFHTRFSTNTAPNPMFAQPFRRIAHNGELNTDRKNRLSEDAIARSHGKRVVFPKGQSDSARLDQTFNRRIIEDKLDIDVAALMMMPPAWENDGRLDDNVSAMLEYFSLFEEKNDGPAALIFSDGEKVGARLDRLGLRPLRSVETDEYLAVMSEAGQIDFPVDKVIRRGRIEAGGMIVFDHARGVVEYTNDVLERLAAEQDYTALVNRSRINMGELDARQLSDVRYESHLSIPARHVAYGMNQESFKFLLDPMLGNGAEKISAMGYGVAPNALAAEEGGMSRYFSQRFAQVTNPPLDSIREADGMTLRVALGNKLDRDGETNKQLVLSSPILKPQQLLQIRSQTELRVETIATLFSPNYDDAEQNQSSLLGAIEDVCSQVESLAEQGCDIIVLSDAGVDHQHAALPAILIASAANQRLIKSGLRFNTSLVFETGQAASTHDIACLLGFGISGVCPLTVLNRAVELGSSDDEIDAALSLFQKAVDKSLMKTMGKFGLCTAESYIGGEFFEANFIDSEDPVLKPIFPNIHSPVGGAGFAEIAQSAAHWHAKIKDIQAENQIPLLGLFKERGDGPGHSYGTTAVREFVNMTEEPIQYIDTESAPEHPLAISPSDDGYRKLGYEACTPEQIDAFQITKAYREFCREVYDERARRPAALRDVFGLPANLSACVSRSDFVEKLSSYAAHKNFAMALQGLIVEHGSDQRIRLRLVDGNGRQQAFSEALGEVFGDQLSTQVEGDDVVLKPKASAAPKHWQNIVSVPSPISLDDVQAAHEITPTFASGAMSHGALVARAHEAVAQGTNIAGAMSNSGEGGENSRRYNSIKSSKIKQFASGRFGVWTGYLADPGLQEIEIKIAQGAKPGEGGQLPAAKVNVEIASARGGTPGVELVSPPPHHDTYSIEDLGQLIHDAKAARVRVIVKLVSSEGVGTIAVGVAKAGANVINIAGSTGGTGAAQVTSLKNTGRAAEIGIAEVHHALSENGLRDSVVLRCSGAHQTGSDVVKSAMLGGDSFEFGTTALMMLKCVMAKNCNVKCPAGLTTNAELYEGDPRALAQYFLNVAHEVREILASLGFKSLRDIRGRADLLHVLAHPSTNGQLDMRDMLRPADKETVEDAVQLAANFEADDAFITEVESELLTTSKPAVQIDGPRLNNRHKTTGGQLAIDVERYLNYTMSAQQRTAHPAVSVLANGRVVLREDSARIKTYNSAGQSYGAFNNSGITLEHLGTCNDGVGKGSSGGRIVVKNPGGGSDDVEGNVLVGNFALFGATGGELFVEGQAGDRFGVRNSGAVAVVEGVGDFCCEYMTNGSVVNLGVYGKGFGNGMSGGNAYQYDPSGQIEQLCSKDSVQVSRLDDGSDLMLGQEQALIEHLSEHVKYTGSARAKHLLDHWDTEKSHFFVMTPRAWYQYHVSSAIASAMNRKAIVEELSSGWSSWFLRRVADAYRNNTIMFDGATPSFGDRDTNTIYQYLNAMGVLRRALEVAEKDERVVNSIVSVDDIAKHMVVSEDRRLLERLVKDIKEALATYSDEAVAALLADKRLRDYKESLQAREVWDTRAWGTSVWIMLRDRDNAAELAQYDALEQSLAKVYYQAFASVMNQVA